MKREKPMTRERLKAFVVKRYSTRLHMSAILFACGLTCMASSWTLLHAGVGSMLVRYPMSLAMAYGMFLIGVWVWLRATGLGPAPKPAGSSFLDNVPDFTSGGGKGGSWGGGSSGSSGGGFAGRGGSFDGGGASASFAETRVPLVGASLQGDVADASSGSSSSSGGSSWGKGLDLDIDGDGLVLIILAALLALAVFLLSGYLIYTAPDVLTEAAFGASLTGVLARPAKEQTQAGWVMGVVRKTWWPFATVLGFALVFAGWSAARFPEATTFKQAISLAANS